MERTILYCLFLILAIAPAGAINWFRNIGVRDGLHENHVCDIRYSPDGLLYIATKLGVDVFDGNHVEALPVAYPEICNPERITFDSAGNLWAVWKDSLMVYDGHGFSTDRTLQQRLASEAGFRLPPAKLSDFILRGRQMAWVNDSGELFHSSDFAKDAVSLNSGTSPYRRTSIAQDGSIWLFGGMTPGLAHINSDKRSDNSAALKLFDNKLVTSIECTPGGKTIIGTNNDGIYVLDHNGVLADHLRFDYKNLKSLPSDHIASLMVHNGYIFAGTTKKGLIMGRLHPLELQCIDTGIDADISFFRHNPDGTLTIGFDGGGLCLYDSIGASVPARRFASVSGDLPSDMVLDFCSDSLGGIYSSYGGGLFRLTPQGHKTVAGGDSLKFCRHLAALPGGGLLAATFDRGLVLLGQRSYTYDNSALRTNAITCLCPIGRNVLVGTATGLYKFDSSTGQINALPDKRLADVVVIDIHVDSHGFTWVGTPEGVLVLNHQLRMIHHIDRHDRLSSSFVKAICSDRSSCIWVSTVNGINRIKVLAAKEDGIEFSCTPYTEQDGIGDIDFDRHSIALANDGRILAGGQGRYVVISPESAYIMEPRQIRFTRFRTDRQNAGPTNLLTAESPTVSINHNNSLQLEFSTLRPEGDRHSMFEYRFDGSDEWIHTEGTVLDIPGLSPGTHVLEIREAGSDSASSLTIVVKPPFWRSDIAVILYIVVFLALAGLTVIVIRNHYRSEIYRRKLENAFADESDSPRSADEEFLAKARTLTVRHMSDEDFSVETLASLMAMSRSNLYKKMSKASGRTPVEFIRLTRLHEGKKLLESGESSVSQVAYAVGMSPKFFSKSFKEEFGLPPSKAAHSSMPAERSS